MLVHYQNTYNINAVCSNNLARIQELLVLCNYGCVTYAMHVEDA